MARKSNPQPLILAEPTFVQNDQNFLDLDTPKSPTSIKSPKSPRSPFRFTTKKFQPEQPSMQAAEPQQQTRTELPQSQTAPALHQFAAGEEQRQDRPTRTGFFSNYKASKSSSRLQNSDSKTVVAEDMSRDTDRPALYGQVSAQEVGRNVEKDTGTDRAVTRRPVGAPSRTDDSIASTDSAASSTHNVIKKSKPKPFSLLGRTRSIRDEKSPRDPSPNNKPLDTVRSPSQDHSVKTAPLRSDTDRSFRDMMGSNQRQHSADRVPTRARDVPSSREAKDGGKSQSSFSSSFREAGGHTFLNNLKAGASKGAGAISKGLFGKGERSNSTNKREAPVDDEHYELKVINKGLVEQTRLTRISKRLEDSRDKTEFWMPAFPWRAIDYLNYKGSDVEGLYRVPGSGPQIKKWQRRFDEELDIDLFEQGDLYDINIIGSMLKAWLRELPDELFPKSSQDKVAKECAANPDNDRVPQLLIDELSALSPFNYYLLFAITCHLSLLLAHSEKNKMDYRNLCICFQPCMKIDAFCFKFLVCDWRDCWKGCKTETEYTRAEYEYFTQESNGNGDGYPPKSREGRSSTAVESHDERNVSSSDSSKPSTASMNDQGKWGQQKKKLPLSQTQASMNTVNTTLMVNQVTPPRRSGDMRPLSPIKPLSPIGL